MNRQSSWRAPFQNLQDPIRLNALRRVFPLSPRRFFFSIRLSVLPSTSSALLLFLREISASLVPPPRGHTFSSREHLTRGPTARARADNSPRLAAGCFVASTSPASNQRNDSCLFYFFQGRLLEKRIRPALSLSQSSCYVRTHRSHPIKNVPASEGPSGRHLFGGPSSASRKSVASCAQQRERDLRGRRRNAEADRV